MSGGNDVFVDIGDKSWGVRACQRYFGGIERSKTLHIGDQFLSAGSNDYKVCRRKNKARPMKPLVTDFLALGAAGMYNSLGCQPRGDRFVIGRAGGVGAAGKEWNAG